METPISVKNATEDDDSIGVRSTDVDKEHPEVEAHISLLEAKFQEFMKSTDAKLDGWMKQVLKKVQDVHVNGSSDETSECANCHALRSRFDIAIKLNIEKEKETTSLKEELNYKNTVIQDLTKQIKCLSDELDAKNNNIAILKLNKQPGYEAKIAQLEITTSKQNLQLAALQEQNNMLTVQNKIKDRMFTSKQNELKKIESQVKSETKLAISKKVSLLQSLQRRRTHSVDLSVVMDCKENTCDEIVVIHDLLRKGFNCGLVKDRKVVVKEIWSSRLRDALSFVKGMEATPKVVLLHTGTNDLSSLSSTQIVKYIVDIYEVLNERNIKFIWSNIVPRCDDIGLNAMGYFVNMKVGKELENKDGAYIARNDDFYLRDMLHPSILDALTAVENEELT